MREGRGMRAMLVVIVGGLLNAAMSGDAAEPPPRPPVCRIQVVDEATGRGVPLVELRTVNQVRYVTDSNGVVAFDEPGLMGRKVVLHRDEPRLRVRQGRLRLPGPGAPR